MRYPVIPLLSALFLMGCHPSPSPVSDTAKSSSGPSQPIPSSALEASLPPVVPQRVKPVQPELAEGKRIFDKTCGLCHGAGTGGAPRPGDLANWAPRIAQGKPVLYQHALEGFNGPQGYMPPRGGIAHSDAEVKAGVDYMVAVSQ